MTLTPEQRLLYSGPIWRHSVPRVAADRLWEAYVALETAHRLAIERVVELERLTDCFCDKPEDRLWHAQDRTWWRREGERLVSADGPQLTEVGAGRQPLAAEAQRDALVALVRDSQGRFASDLAWQRTVEEAEQITNGS